MDDPVLVDKVQHRQQVFQQLANAAFAIDRLGGDLLVQGAPLHHLLYQVEIFLLLKVGQQGRNLWVFAQLVEPHGLLLK